LRDNELSSARFLVDSPVETLDLANAIILQLCYKVNPEEITK